MELNVVEDKRCTTGIKGGSTVHRLLIVGMLFNQARLRKDKEKQAKNMNYTSDFYESSDSG